LSAPRPEIHIFQKLIELEICSIKDGKYYYSDKFTENVGLLVKHGMSRLKQMAIGRKAASSMTTTILAYKCFRNRRNIDNLMYSYTCFIYHLDKIKVKVPNNKDELVYGVWYLNDHEPEVD